MLARKLCSSVVIHLSLAALAALAEIALVPYEHYHHVWLCVLPQLLHPLATVLESTLLRGVVDEQGSDSPAVVGTSDGAVPLLACGVPDLCLHRTAHRQWHRARGKLDTNSRSGSFG